MPATRQDLFDFLDRVGIGHATQTHAPVFTVAESGAVKAAMPGGHTKNLFLKDKKGGLFLLCALAETRIDLNALAKALGAGRFSFGAPELLLECLGVTPGSVTVFALINDAAGRVTLLLDAGLREVDPVNFHPLSNDATTAITPDGLLAFVAALGRKPQFIRFDAAGHPLAVE